MRFSYWGGGGCWIIKGRKWEVLLLINPGGDLCFNFFVAGDNRVVALDDFVRDVGVLTVYSTDCFSVFFLFFKSTH